MKGYGEVDPTIWPPAERLVRWEKPLEILKFLSRIFTWPFTTSWKVIIDHEDVIHYWWFALWMGLAGLVFLILLVREASQGAWWAFVAICVPYALLTCWRAVLYVDHEDDEPYRFVG